MNVTPTNDDGTLTYAVTGLTADSPYSFRLRADLNGLASYSNTAQATPADANSDIPAPQDPQFTWDDTFGDNHIEFDGPYGASDDPTTWNEK